MAVTQGRTREQLRQSIGRNLAGHRLIVSASSTSSTSTTTLKDDTLLGGDDNYNGWWIAITSTDANAGSIRQISDYNSTASRLNWIKAVSANPVTATAYELWPPDYPPANVHDYIDQAVIEATGRVYDPVEDLSLHADGVTTRFDIPTGVDMIRELRYRASVSSNRIHLADSIFDSSTYSGFTQTLDTKDKKQGASSLKIGVSAGSTAGATVADSVTGVDISGHTHLEFWIKPSISVTGAGDLQIILNDGSTDQETINVPALTADVWTFIRQALSQPENDTAITTVKFKYVTDLGACTIWLDDIRAVHNDTAVWRTLPAHLWSIDKEARDLVLTDGGKRLAGYAPLKLIGGQRPALLSSDTDVTEISDQFVTARATALALLSSPGSPESNQGTLAYWDAQARSAYSSLPLLTNARTVD